VKIHTVAVRWVGPPQREFFEDLAARNGGEFIDASR
jgi:hypothetical protein